MIGLISINHKTASLSRREQFALGDEEAVQLITQWKEELSLLGGFVLSTCNRLEIYYEAPQQVTSELEGALIRSLYRFKRIRHSGDESIFTTPQHHRLETTGQSEEMSYRFGVLECGEDGFISRVTDALEAV